MATILVTNDDGVFAPGLLALKQALTAIADVIVLAPERNWSASSHIKTMHKPLRVHKATLADGSGAFNSRSSRPTAWPWSWSGGRDRPRPGSGGRHAGHNLRRCDL